jgi:DNA-directed RNA polymerase specialized sigma24 family protein
MVTQATQKQREDNEFARFYARLEPFLADLQQFLKGSLRDAEDQGLLDRRYFDPDEILDEVLLEGYKQYATEKDEKTLRRGLFRRAVLIILTKEMEDVPDEVNTHSLLKAELKTLSEDFTAEGDGDPILLEDLDDISYSQKRGWNPEIRLNDALEKQLVKKFELHEESLLSEEKRKLLGLLYSTIPERSKMVVELYAFGHQDTHEISEILEVPERVVERILFKVKERFRLL